jgi:predicted MFS family arabinose efflux permease
MLSPLANAAYRRLFAAQVSALLGTGLTTIALGLLAHDLAGARAGEILGAALAIKMICYVGVAPVASAIAANVPRKTLLVGLDLARALVAIALPFVTEAWHIFALMAVLYVASAAFTPAFQAMIPEILANEAEYTKALSLSRLAADLESVASPILAAALLGFMSYNTLFAGTSLGFVLSASLVVSAALPALSRSQPRPFLQRLTSGLNLFIHTPRLRALIALSLATAAGGAMVFVNTVVLVQSAYGLGESATAWALAVFGAGSIFAALALPRLLEGRSDRTVLIAGALVMSAALGAGALFVRGYASMLLLWALLGLGYSLTLTPVGRVLRRSSHAEDRPALFAAHFALSHGAWLVAYPLSGFVSASIGTGAAFVTLCVLCIAGAGATALLWPADDPESLPHTHDDLPADHPHVSSGGSHAHTYIVDTLHSRWPR